MPLNVADRVRDTTTTTGTGTITLSGTPPTGYQSFSAVGNGNTTYYTINAGSQWEVGIGTYLGAGPTLSRDTVLSSSNGGSLVNFAAGTKDVFCDYPASKSISDGFGTLPIANGGTGSTSAPAALTALGAYPASNPNGYTSNTGTVTSVAGTGTVNGITLTGTVTTSGSLTLGGTLSGVSLTSQVTGTLPVANGGTGVTTSTGTGSVVLSNSPTLVTPTLGAASATSITNALGAVGTPSYTFTGDTNTGIYSPAADTIAFVEGGVEAMRLDSSGNVGIGVVPSVGYGRELSISSDPAAGVGTFGSRGLATGNNILYMANNAKNTGAFTDAYWTAAPASKYTQNQGVHQWFYAPTGTAGATISFSEAMRIDGSGNVGIGTSAPSSRLTITGGITEIRDGNYLMLRPSGNAWDMRLQATGTQLDILSGGSLGSPIMSLLNGGNVGIGTSSPSTRLDVNSTVTLSGAENSQLRWLNSGKDWRANTSAGGNWYLYDATNNKFPFTIQGNAPSDAFYMTSAGNVGIGTSSTSAGYGSGKSLMLTNQSSVLFQNASNTWNTSTAGGAVTYFSDNNLYLDAKDSASNMIFRVNGATERMRITSNGVVGIGTSVDNGIDKLTVAGIVGSSVSGRAGFHLYNGGATAEWFMGQPSGSSHNLTFSKLIAGTYTDYFAIDTVGGITSANLADAVGYKGLPQNQQTGAYTLVLADMGKHIYATAGAFAITIPANATTAFPIGTAITIVVEDAGKTVVPASGVTLVLAGTGAATTGTRTMAIGSVATIIKVGTNRWYISGSGVT